MLGTARKTLRRNALLAIVAMLVAGLDIACAPTSSGAVGPDPRPNILIILTDDHRLEGTMAVLPAVGRWFGEAGRMFPNAFSTTPLCCPSRATILTGQFAHNHGILNNDDTGRTVFDEGTTVERYLQDAGYRTAIFGKYFNFWRVEDDPSFFDRWAIISPSRHSNGYRDGAWNVQGQLRTVHRYSTDYIAAQGARFIRNEERHDAEPWFLELATYAPHLRAVPEPAYEDAPVGPFRPTPAMKERDRSDKPPFLQPEHAALAGVGVARSRQLRTLMSVDDLVQKLAVTLRRTGETRDTLAFFLSDNGFLWGEHGARSKGYPYGPGVQVPLLVRWPGHIRNGSVDRRLAATVDITPTILDAAGIEPNPAVPLDGRSLLDRGWSRPRMLLEFWPWSGSSSVAWASSWAHRYQYTEYYDDAGEIVFREYYDLVHDRWQLVNLLHDGDPGNDPDVGPLHDQLTADRSCVGGACP